MGEIQSFEVKMKLLDEYKFEIDFGDYGKLLSDETEPLGKGEGPNPSRLLASSVANCLSASLLFALRKYNNTINELSAVIKGELSRVDGRWRIESLDVELNLPGQSDDYHHLQRVLSQFEDFCIVTQSVRQGIKVNTLVTDSRGKKLHAG